jgi:hypothetical protein
MANDPDDMPDLPPSEDAERLRAEMDQALAGLADVAQSIRAFHLGLTAQGFTEAQALKLTSAWMVTTMTQGGDDV